MPPNHWASSNRNGYKRQRIAPSRCLPTSLSRKVSSPRVNNHGDVQNQAGTQTIQGHQMYGNFTIQNGTPAVESDLEVLTGVRKSLAFPGMLARRPGIEQPYPGTCTWILNHEHYRRWRETPNSLLWIKGKPGSGKSTLMSHLYRSHHSGLDLVSEGHVHLDFFFHARGSELQHSRIGMARTLLNQLMSQAELISQHPYIASNAIASYREKCTAYGRPSSTDELKWEWQLPELEQLLFDAIIEASKSRQVVVFIDALDEAGTEHARDVAEYLRRIHVRASYPCSENTTRKLKMCISSRHYPVEPAYESIILCMEDNNHKDITKVVIDEIDTIKLRTDCPAELKESIDSTWDKFTDEALRHARGVFQWVRLVLRLAIQEFDNGRSVKNIDAFFRNIPRDLKDLYAYILSSVLDQNRIQESLLLFQLVLFAEDRLEPTQIMCALTSSQTGYRTRAAAVQPNPDLQSMTKYIRSLSGGLLELTDLNALSEVPSIILSHSHVGSNLVVQAVHQTVNEYLWTEGLQLLSQRCVCAGTPLLTEQGRTKIIQQSHLALYECCLTHIEGLDSSFVLSQIQQTEINPPIALMSEYQPNDSLGMIDPFTIYATRYMFTHARKALRFWNLSDHEIRRLERIEHLNALFSRVICSHDPYSIVSFDSLLDFASYFELINLLQYLIDHGYPVDQVNSKGITPLYTAGYKGFLEGCRLLLSAGADINIVTHFRRSPLAFAADLGKHETVAWMVENGADIDPLTNDKDSALAFAARRGRHSICKLLLDTGANVNFKSIGAGAIGTPLHSAAGSRELKLVQLFLDAGADVNASGGQYGSALHAAAYYDDTQIVQVLINAGVDLNIEGGEYCTALQIAAYHGCYDVARILIDAGADVNVRGGICSTALQAARQGDDYWKSFTSPTRHKEIIEMLLRAGAKEVKDMDEIRDENPHSATCKDKLG